MTDYLTEYIGQTDSKSRLNFYINQHKKSGFLPPIGLFGARGLGKTELARSVAKNLENSEGKIKKYVEVNSSTLKGIQDFIDDLYTPFIAGSQEITILLDEAHGMGHKLNEWLLTATNTEKTNVNTVSYNGQDFEFNYNKLSLLIATTNPEKLSQPFLSRFRRFDLAQYTEKEISIILLNTLREKNIEIKEELALDISSYCRGTPRNSIHLSKDIVGYCLQEDNLDFNKDGWAKLRKILGIKPLGLTNQEIQVLKELNTGAKTLTNLAARLKVDRQTLQKDVECFLLSNNLMQVDGKRFITQLGQNIVKSL
jgi:Holliday junction DNA helicase RuvB